jgi:hypothetical protein
VAPAFREEFGLAPPPCLFRLIRRPVRAAQPGSNMRFVVRFAVFAALLLGASAGSSNARAESVMSACAAEWKQAQAAGTAAGAAWPQFLAQCKTRHLQPSPAAAAPAPAPAPAPAQSGSLFPWWQPSAPPQTAAPAPTGAGQFRTEAEARYRCPTDKVVWVNTSSHVYHYQGARYYGATKQGAYMCEADAKAAGDRPSRTIFHQHFQG